MRGVTGPPRLWLRLEGAATLLASVALYHTLHASWILFAALFLVPDLSMLGYIGGSRAGAMVYNTVHSYLLPLLLLLGVVILRHSSMAAPYLLIWTAHIGLDRAFGYGLKYPSGFGATHLGQIGRREKPISVNQ